MNTATQKQIDFARAIAERLHLQLPGTETKESYRAFISAHISDFRKSRPPFTGEATERQILFVKKIAACLKIGLPESTTKEAYSLFISAHIKEFKRTFRDRYKFKRYCPSTPQPSIDEFEGDIEGLPFNYTNANMTHFVYDDLLLPQD